MAMHLMRIVLPDEPGQLGAVATALGTQGADIVSVEIVGRENGSVIDDFMVQLAPDRLPDQVVSACLALPGVRVEWIAFYPEGGTLQSDLEALDRMTTRPARAAEILTDSAVSVFHAHWAVLVADVAGAPDQVHGTAQAPELTGEQLAALTPYDQVRAVSPAADWLPGWRDVIVAIAPVPGDRAIVLGRQGGPEFLPSELARLGHLAALVPTRA